MLAGLGLRMAELVPKVPVEKRWEVVGAGRRGVLGLCPQRLGQREADWRPPRALPSLWVSTPSSPWFRLPGGLLGDLPRSHQQAGPVARQHSNTERAPEKKGPHVTGLG